MGLNIFLLFFYGKELFGFFFIFLLKIWVTFVGNRISSALDCFVGAWSLDLWPTSMRSGFDIVRICANVVPSLLHYDALS